MSSYHSAEATGASPFYTLSHLSLSLSTSTFTSNRSPSPLHPVRPRVDEVPRHMFPPPPLHPPLHPISVSNQYPLPSPLPPPPPHANVLMQSSHSNNYSRSREEDEEEGVLDARSLMPTESHKRLRGDFSSDVAWKEKEYPYFDRDRDLDREYERDHDSESDRDSLYYRDDVREGYRDRDRDRDRGKKREYNGEEREKDRDREYKEPSLHYRDRDWYRSQEGEERRHFERRNGHENGLRFQQRSMFPHSQPLSSPALRPSRSPAHFYLPPRMPSAQYFMQSDHVYPPTPPPMNETTSSVSHHSFQLVHPQPRASPSRPVESQPLVERPHHTIRSVSPSPQRPPPLSYTSAEHDKNDLKTAVLSTTLLPIATQTHTQLLAPLNFAAYVESEPAIKQASKKAKELLAIEWESRQAHIAYLEKRRSLVSLRSDCIFASLAATIATKDCETVASDLIALDSEIAALRRGVM